MGKLRSTFRHTIYWKKQFSSKSELTLQHSTSFGRKLPKEPMQRAENLNVSRDILQSILRSLFNSSEEDAQYYLDSTTNQNARNTMLLVMTHKNVDIS